LSEADATGELSMNRQFAFVMLAFMLSGQAAAAQGASVAVSQPDWTTGLDSVELSVDGKPPQKIYLAPATLARQVRAHRCDR
jgi:hypothetical protein